MSIRILGFRWDIANLEHLRQSHPDLQPEQLEEIVESAKEYSSWGTDRFGKRIYGAKGGKVIVLFNLVGDGEARIFSVRRVK